MLERWGNKLPGTSELTGVTLVGTEKPKADPDSRRARSEQGQCSMAGRAIQRGHLSHGKIQTHSDENPKPALVCLVGGVSFLTSLGLAFLFGNRDLWQSLMGAPAKILSPLFPP